MSERPIHEIVEDYEQNGFMSLSDEEQDILMSHFLDEENMDRLEHRREEGIE